MAAALALLLFGCVLLQGVLSRRFEISLPQTIEALNGSCVTIPCTFDIENRFQSNLDNTCRGLWFENDLGGPLAFNSSDPQQSKIKGNLDGDLMSKDCTTTLNDIKPEHNNNYMFRLECNNALKWWYAKSSVRISVTGAPQRPTLTPSTLKVREGTSVSLTCSAPAPCPSLPPTLTWTPGLGESQETLKENQDKTQFKTSVVNFTASHLHNKWEISCTAVYRKQGGSTESSVISSLTTDITYPPKDTTVSVSPSGPVEEDTNVTLTCSSHSNPAVMNYSWYRYDDGGQEVFIGTGRVFSIRASKVSGPVFCRAGNELGAGKSDTVHLDVRRHECSCISSSGFSVLTVAGVSLTLSIINTICMILLWKQRQTVKPKEEDKTYATLESSNRSPDYDVIAQRHK